MKKKIAVTIMTISVALLITTFGGTMPIWPPVFGTI